MYRPYLKTLHIQYFFYPEDGNIALLRSIFSFLPDYQTRRSKQQYGLFCAYSLLLFVHTPTLIFPNPMYTLMPGFYAGVILTL